MQPQLVLSSVSLWLYLFICFFIYHSNWAHTMCQAYIGSGDMAGNNHGSSTHRAYTKRENLPVAHTPSYVPDSIFCSIIANFCKPINIFFTSLQGKTQCPIFFYHYQRCPSVCGPSLFRYMYTGMNSLLEAMFPVIVNLQNKRKG